MSLYFVPSLRRRARLRSRCACRAGCRHPSATYRRSTALRMSAMTTLSPSSGKSRPGIDVLHVIVGLVGARWRRCASVATSRIDDQLVDPVDQPLRAGEADGGAGDLLDRGGVGQLQRQAGHLGELELVDVVVAAHQRHDAGAEGRLRSRFDWRRCASASESSGMSLTVDQRLDHLRRLRAHERADVIHLAVPRACALLRCTPPAARRAPAGSGADVARSRLAA